MIIKQFNTDKYIIIKYDYDKFYYNTIVKEKLNYFFKVDSTKKTIQDKINFFSNDNSKWMYIQIMNIIVEMVC